MYQIAKIAQATINKIEKLLVQTAVTATRNNSGKKTIGGYNLRPINLEEVIDPVYNWFPAVRTPNSETAAFMSNPNGWYGLSKDNDIPVASLATLHKANDTTWYSYFYIIEKLRQKGIAKNLFAEIMAEDEQQGIKRITFQCFKTLEPLYGKYGFKKIHEDSINNAQFKEPYEPKLVSAIPTIEFNPMVFNAIMDYDKKVQHGHSRKGFLSHWLTKPNTETLVTLNNNTVVGYSVVNKFYFESETMGNHHRRIAPLYADTPELADSLLKTSLAVATAGSENDDSRKSVFCDTDGSNPVGIEILNKIGFFKPVVPLSRMTRVVPNTPKPKNFYDATKVYGFMDFGCGP